MNIGLVQIGEQFGNQYYLPYAIGVLQAYAQRYLTHPELYQFLTPIYKKQPLEEILGVLREADAIFFSTYVWNFRMSQEIAKGVKAINPQCITVFGGPQIPEARDEMHAFLRSSPFVDIASYGEGELPFLGILENLRGRSWHDIPAVAFIEGSECCYKPPAKRIVNMDEIPSPYLAGVFDPLMGRHPEDGWAALLETNRGCPFSCAFCYWGKKEKNRIHQYSLQRVYEEIDWISRNKIEFVFCCDANFGIYERDREIVEKVKINKETYRYPQAFSVQNTKNSSEKIFSLQRALNNAGLQKGVNLALQSLHRDTLESIGRKNISNDTYRDLITLFAGQKIPTFTDLIIGLPSETYDSLVTGISQLLEGGQHNRIQFINLTLLPNTVMHQKEYVERYGLVLQDSKLVSHHTQVENDGIVEYQRLVVGSDAMPEPDWIKARVFCWTASLLHFNKLLQLVFIVLNRIYRVTYRTLMEWFVSPDGEFEILREIQGSFRAKAKAIQSGDCEYVASREFMNLWWPIDEYYFIKLCFEGRLEAFYAEAEMLIRRCSQRRDINLPGDFLHALIALNRDLMKRPFQGEKLKHLSRFNLLEVYAAALNNGTVPLTSGKYTYLIHRDEQVWPSWPDWAREVVWYGSKRGDYLYRWSRVDDGI